MKGCRENQASCAAQTCPEVRRLTLLANMPEWWRWIVIFCYLLLQGKIKCSNVFTLDKRNSIFYCQCPLLPPPSPPKKDRIHAAGVALKTAPHHRLIKSIRGKGGIRHQSVLLRSRL